MRVKYPTTDTGQGEIGSLPRLPLNLSLGSQSLNVMGLVDSGSTVNVIPFDMGVQLGAVWNQRKATMRLAGSLGRFPAQPLFVVADIGDLPPTRLAFAWVRTNDAPLILGQMNFFLEFEVCFFRASLEFEIKPRSDPA